MPSACHHVTQFTRTAHILDPIAARDRNYCVENGAPARTRRNRLRKPLRIASRTRGRVPEQRTEVFTDGACRGNPGPGGWAWAVPGGAFASGAEAHTTNQRMEISAAFEAVQTLPGPLEIVSDSTYVVNCFRDRWHEGWRRKGWLNSQKKPVANRDLWEPFVELVLARGDVTFRWVKGHSGDAMNDVVDRLAVEAAKSQEGRSGDEPP